MMSILFLRLLYFISYIYLLVTSSTVENRALLRMSLRDLHCRIPWNSLHCPSEVSVHLLDTRLDTLVGHLAQDSVWDLCPVSQVCRVLLPDLVQDLVHLDQDWLSPWPALLDRLWDRLLDNRTCLPLLPVTIQSWFHQDIPHHLRVRLLRVRSVLIFMDVTAKYSILYLLSLQINPRMTRQSSTHTLAPKEVSLESLVDKEARAPRSFPRRLRHPHPSMDGLLLLDQQLLTLLPTRVELTQVHHQDQVKVVHTLCLQPLHPRQSLNTLLQTISTLDPLPTLETNIRGLRRHQPSNQSLDRHLILQVWLGQPLLHLLHTLLLHPLPPKFLQSLQPDQSVDPVVEAILTRANSNRYESINWTGNQPTQRQKEQSDHHDKQTSSSFFSSDRPFHMTLKNMNIERHWHYKKTRQDTKADRLNWHTLTLKTIADNTETQLPQTLETKSHPALKRLLSFLSTWYSICQIDPNYCSPVAVLDFTGIILCMLFVHQRFDLSLRDWQMKPLETRITHTRTQP